jgi:hypothetical protein
MQDSLRPVKSGGRLTESDFTREIEVQANSGAEEAGHFFFFLA